MGNKHLQTLKGNDGQSALEYILLLMVVVSLSMTVFKSDAFKNFMGPDSVYFETLRKRFEYTYRYGSPPITGTEEGDSNAYSSRHDSYYNSTRGQTRFFTPAEPYP
ncbi:MAG: hypothetical protein E2O68_06065 [Deltaproteobacteria bacterium]|nr:MAG: hypothetical protein E2O68_06065 [Deltaproteobacteria bacterium]